MGEPSGAQGRGCQGLGTCSLPPRPPSPPAGTGKELPRLLRRRCATAGTYQGRQPSRAGGDREGRTPGDRGRPSGRKVPAIAAGAAEHRRPGPGRCSGSAETAQRLRQAARWLQLGTSSKVFCCSFCSRPGTHSGSRPTLSTSPGRGRTEAELGVPAGELALGVRPLRPPEDWAPASPTAPRPASGSQAEAVSGLPRLPPGPDASLRALPPASCRRPGRPAPARAPRGRQRRSRLPEKVSPAAVSKSPAKVARQVPSLLMVVSARRAAPRRRWVGARGRWGPGDLVPRQRGGKGKQQSTEPSPQSANSCRSPNSSGSRGAGTGSWVFLPCPWPHSASGAAVRGS